MAITTVGFDGTVTESQWARFMRHHGEVAYKHGVTSGLVASAAGGTRSVSVTAGTAVLPGLLTDSSVTETVTFAANGTAVNRIDALVLRADWSANTVTFAAVTGVSSTTNPSPTQSEGSVWEMPVAWVTVRPSVGTFLASDVAVCKPLPRAIQTRHANTFTTTNRAWNAALLTISTLTFPDPGWPYRLQVSASARFDGGSGYNGYVLLQSNVNGAAHALAFTEQLGNAGGHAAQITARTTTTTYTGPVSLTLQFAPHTQTAASAGADLQANSENHFTVNQLPA